MMHFFQISISPVLFLVIRWQTFSNCLSDYVRITYLLYMTCILLRMSIGYLEPLVRVYFAGPKVRQVARQVEEKCCPYYWTFRGNKKIQATKQDLGTFQLFFSKFPTSFFYGSLPARGEGGRLTM